MWTSSEESLKMVTVHTPLRMLGEIGSWKMSTSLKIWLISENFRDTMQSVLDEYEDIVKSNYV